MLIAILWISSLIVMYFIGRNNPNLGAVNRLIAAKKAMVNGAGQIVSAIKLK